MRSHFQCRGAVLLYDGLRLTRQSHDEWWTQPRGEVARVRDCQHELAVAVQETAAQGHWFTLRGRAFDDGTGLRYTFRRQPGLDTFDSSDERTETALADIARTGWIPSDRPRMAPSEMLRSSSPVSRPCTGRSGDPPPSGETVSVDG
jgi:hypothetical protein